MNIICTKDGCKVTNDTPKEIKHLIDEWDKEIEMRTEKRKRAGCCNPEAAVCDCPGFND